MIRALTRFAMTSIALVMTLLAVSVVAAEIPNQLPDPGDNPPAADKPVRVYILSGQSNMVGIGQVGGGGTRWKNVTGANVAVYPGMYAPHADYDTLKPIKTKELASYGGVKPTPFPGGGVQVARGFIEIEASGIYRFSPGYANSTFNIMELDGVEVYRREVDEDAKHTLFKITGGKKYPFKITFLTDAADGLGWWHRTDIPGTLETVVKSEKKFPHLVDDAGNWTIRNDVWYRGLVTAGANKWLSVGCGASSNQIGPELGFGHIMGFYHDEPVIILKSSQGNRSLGWDFLPPGSERFTFDGRTYAGYKDTPSSWIEGEPKKEVNWYAGKQYDDCFGAVHKVLDNFGSEFPQFKDQGYEIAGFVWWQGHKDGGSAAHAGRYERNLVHLIKTLRQEFNAPDAPFVIGTIGFGGWEMSGNQLTVADAQLAVSGDKNKYPEFAGNVLTVETRDYWKDASVSPRNQSFHYNGNAETYLRIGDALGRGMVTLLEKSFPEQNEQAVVQRENFTVAGHNAFVLEPPQSTRVDGPMPWVWYAPTLPGLPGGAEKWMFDHFHQAGIAIAGVDVGESYGSPKGRAIYQSLYQQLTASRGYAKKPVLLARSRGGLMLYSWAVENPESVGGIAGIYPVCNIASYPGVERAAGAYELTAEELKAKLTEHNPIDRLAPLAKAKVPIFHIHGDTDRVVPLDVNSAELAKRYKALGGPVEIEVIEGQGHNMWNGWFESQKLTKFIVARAMEEQ